MNPFNGSEISEESSYELLQQLQKKKLQEKAQECFERLQQQELAQSHDDLTNGCSPVWDDVYCWPAAKAGETISVPCPSYIMHFTDKENATRRCMENGEWYIHPTLNKTWSNYTLCHPELGSSLPPPQHFLIKEWLPVIKTMSQIGYTLSFCTLLIAFLILVSIKRLRCPRNTLHMHLFLSFIMRAFITLLKDTLYFVGLPQSMLDGGFDQEHSNWECKTVTTLWQYFIIANYSWILMEGLYLHNLIFLAPFSDSSAITLYVILGWGLPIPVILAWVLCRVYLDDTLCWTTNHTYKSLFLIIRIPIIFTIMLNFVFFVNICRVLLVKLQSSVSIETRKYRYRKWGKSTLVLVPLFGVHYMIFIGMSAYMDVNPLIEIIWLFCDQFFASFQGFFVAVLYCLINGEVRCEIKRKWRGWRTSGNTDTKDVWVPLRNITSRLNHRSTQEMALSATSMGVDHTECEAAQPLKGNFDRKLDQECTEEHHIQITQGD